MTTENTKAIAEAQIHALIDEWATAIRAKDVNRVMSHYAADIVTFDLTPPLQYTGADALRKGLEARGSPRSKARSATRCVT
jgi:ketosteroid isomerase-like protein